MDYKNLFITNLYEAKPDGDIHGFLEWLSTTDFFYAPCSTRFHLSVEGGLLKHSINVLEAGLKLLESDLFCELGINTYSVVLCCLLHDLCKINTYKPTYRNKKIYVKAEDVLPEGSKRQKDQLGWYYWSSEPSYIYEENFAYGHGEKSVLYASKFFKLTDEEAQAIRFHMGAFQEADKQLCSKAFSDNPLALLVHLADLYASKIMEVENGN